MKKMLMALAMGAALCGAAEFRIEATAMEEVGEGWLTHCSGTQGKMRESNAKNIKLTGTYILPQGQYAVWVRTDTNNENWRKLQLKINGASFGKYGDEKVKDYTKPRKHWKKALLPLKVEDASKPIKVEIIALSQYGRIDCLVLSDNPNFVPSNDNAELEEIEEIESAE